MSTSATHAHGAVIDSAALDEALENAAQKIGRLSDEQVRALRRRRRTAMTVPGALAALALLFAALIPFAERFAPSAPPAHMLATQPGETGTARFADGSTIKLNGATRVRVHYSAGERSVELLAGQAFFNVAHDPTRPFVVTAGSGEARVLGTAFDLNLTDHQLSLAVYRGAVGFDAVEARGGVVVRAGYRSQLRKGAMEAPTRFDPALPDWREGWIDTDGMRLDDLIDVLGRQGAGTVAPLSDDLAGITIAGRFRTDRPGELLRAIGDGFGFAVEERDDGVLLLKRSD